MIDALRYDIRGWTRATIAADLGDRALAALDRDIAVPAALAAQSGSRIGLLTRLLWLGDILDDAELAVALPAVAGSGLAGATFLERADGGWRSRWQIVPVDVPAHLSAAGTVWIASSHGALQGARHGDHFVMGVGGATHTLAALAAYEPGQRVLDLGTGSGIHAILAALAGAEVVATDISTAALDLAAFNAELNAVTIDLRHGSLFEPVSSPPERFDVVVSNPPFVITPASARGTVGALDYRDGGLDGDQISARVIGGLSEHLTEDGRAWMLINWEIADSTDPYAPIREWAGTELDIHLIMRERIPVTAYIETWLRDGGLRPDDPDFAPSYRAWLADFDARNVTEIGLGYLAAGLGDGEILGQELRGIPPVNLHDYMERIWQGRKDTQLGQLAPVATNVVEHRFYRPGESEPWIIKFTQTHGFEEEIVADTALAGFVSVSDGELTTSQIIAALADLLGAQRATLTKQLMPGVAQLKRLGMLTFVQPPCD